MKSICSIYIVPPFASEKLQELDLLQYSLCAQIKGLPQKDSLRKTTTIEYIKTLQGMLKVAQKPDSNLYSKVSKLESAEAIRSAKEKQLNDLRLTPPKVDVALTIRNNNELGISLVFLNDVPITCDFYVTKYGSDASVAGILLEKPRIYPTGDKVFHINYQDIAKWDLPKTANSKLTLHFRYESIYYSETLNPALKYKIIKSYIFDPSKLQIQEVEEQIIKYTN